MNALSPWLQAIVWTSAQASLLALGVLGLQWVLRSRVPARWRFMLWFVVLAGFVPMAWPESKLSLMNWLPRQEKTRPTEPSPERAHGAPAPWTVSPVVPVEIAPSTSPLATNAPSRPASPPIPALSTAPAIPAVAPEVVHTKAAPVSLWTLLFFAGAFAVALRSVVASIRLRRIVQRASEIQDKDL